MNSSTLSGNRHLQLRRIGRQTSRSALLLGMFVASSWAAAAGGASAFDNGDGTDIPPWTPDILAAIDEYVPAPSFNNGRFSLDHFAAANSLDQQGLVTAQLANGDMVIAGLVPDGVAGGFCGDGTTLCSIGLVRYNTAGQRVPWSNPGDNGRYFDNYSVFPSIASPLPRYQYLRDVKVRGNRIDVLVDQPDRNIPGSPLGNRDVSVVTFLDNGQQWRNISVFGQGSFGAPGDNEDFYGAQMVQTDSAAVTIAATAYDSVGSYVAITRMIIIDNDLHRDTDWGVPYAGTSSTRLYRYLGPSDSCAVPINSRCNVTANYVARPVASTSAYVYVQGSVQNAGNDWNAMTLKLHSVNGTRPASFGGDGWVVTQFDQANSSNRDIGAGLYVYQDDVYLAAQVARKCHDGIGVAKLNGATGAYNATFGSGGKIVFGGQGNAMFCIAQGIGTDYPFAISATGGRIGIVGYESFRDLNNSVHVDPMLAVVNAVDGTLIDFNTHPVKRADGSRYGDAVLFGIYGGPLPTSPFTVSGNGRDASAGNTLSYVAGKLVPISSDRIFGTGFE